MPTYVYECEKCGKVFEAEQRMSDDPLKDCDCGGKGTLKRLIQPTAMMFKGEGFHVNDYAPSADKKAQAEPCGPDCACDAGSDDD
ncbi:MAG: zinc ribbon domain-containing protein [Armatimonadetes bacterium]|nr:zinc ribbon domain-containing protein [Armatimonadota bacterium]